MVVPSMAQCDWFELLPANRIVLLPPPACSTVGASARKAHMPRVFSGRVFSSIAPVASVTVPVMLAKVVCDQAAPHRRRTPANALSKDRKRNMYLSLKVLSFGAPALSWLEYTAFRRRF